MVVSTGVTVAKQTYELRATITKFGVAGVLDIGGTLIVTRQPNGTLDLAIVGADVTVKVQSTTVVNLKGYAAFTISPTTGFRLAGFKVDSFSLFPGVTSGLLAVSPGTPATAPLLPPTADLAAPLNGQIRTLGQVRTTAGGGVFRVTFTTRNPGGIKDSSIVDPDAEFEVWANGVKTNLVLGTPVKVAGINTWEYAWSGTLPSAGVVEIRFLAGGFSDNNNIGSLAEVEQFYLVPTAEAKPGPVAALASPLNGERLTAASLNARRYLDVTFTSLDGSAIRKSSIEDAAAEFKLTGTGLADVLLDAAGAPVLVGMPLLISGRAADAQVVTYRYFFKDRDTKNSVDLFKTGSITVQFLGSAADPAWTTALATSNVLDTTGKNIPGLTQTFTLDPATPGAGSSGGGMNLGPLTLQDPTVGIADVGFADGLLVLTIALGVNRASLDFGRKADGTGTTGAQTGSGVTVDLLGVQGTFDLAVDALGLLSGNVRIEPTGKWGLRIASLEAVIPDVATLTAQGVVFNYDPAPAKDDGTQELLRIASADITFPKLGLTGRIRPYDPGRRRTSTRLRTRHWAPASCRAWSSGRTASASAPPSWPTASRRAPRTG